MQFSLAIIGLEHIFIVLSDWFHGNDGHFENLITN